MIQKLKWRIMRKRELYCFYNHETGSYLKLLLMPYFWKKGIDPYYQPDVLTISLGPLCLVTAHDSQWGMKKKLKEAEYSYAVELDGIRYEPVSD